MTEYVEFKDKNLQLLVLEHLMYIKKLIEPKFELRKFADNYEGREINLDEEGHDIIPEAMEYLLSIRIKPEWLNEITELYQDGGSFIWLEIIPYWSGYGGEFAINSSEDLELLPNLKKIKLFFNDENPGILEEFGRKGVIAEWV